VRDRREMAAGIKQTWFVLERPPEPDRDFATTRV